MIFGTIINEPDDGIYEMIRSACNQDNDCIDRGKSYLHHDVGSAILLTSSILVGVCVYLTYEINYITMYDTVRGVNR
mgnify:CR=1 FL=1